MTRREPRVSPAPDSDAQGARVTQPDALPPRAGLALRLLFVSHHDGPAATLPGSVPCDQAPSDPCANTARRKGPRFLDPLRWRGPPAGEGPWRAAPRPDDAAAMLCGTAPLARLRARGSVDGGPYPWAVATTMPIMLRSARHDVSSPTRPKMAALQWSLRGPKRLAATRRRMRP